MALGGISLFASAAPAQTPRTDDELTRHLSGMKRQLEDGTIDPSTRATLALEMAATLDRAARSEARVDAKIARWDEAIAVLDGFNAKEVSHERAREFELQAGVYRWAQARAWHDNAILFPADSRSKDLERAALDDAVMRLRKIAGGGTGALLDNIRFRLAWALADRARFEDLDSPTRRARLVEALDLLNQPLSESNLTGYHELLKAEVLHLIGRPGEALQAVARAEKADPAPPERETLETLVRLLTAQSKFSEAKSRVEKSKVPLAAKALLLVRVALAELQSPIGPKGADRVVLEGELFAEVQSLRAMKAPEIRVALSEWAAAGVEPEGSAKPEAWDALAEGFDIRGDAERAAALEEKAAEAAERDGHREAAALYRLRGGGFLYQAGKFEQADAALQPVIADPEAGPSRAKAGLLRALARGRALSAGSTKINRADYAQALERQLREFPDDPSSAEVRWLLGGVKLSAGDFEAAEALWMAIPVDSPRWIDARLALAQSMRQKLEDELATTDRAKLDAEYQAAADFVDESAKAARSRPEADHVELLLAEARLNALPVAGKPLLARDAADRCLAMSLTPSQRYRAKLIRMVALVGAGRYVDAEREADRHSDWGETSERAALMDAVRLLDLCASNADTNLLQRRFGLVLRLLVQPLTRRERDETLTADQWNELTLRLARALLFQGDEQGARAALRDWIPSAESADDRLLRDLADAYSRLGADELAIDVQRLRLKKLSSASPAWFDARYGLSLAYYRLGRTQEALRLIEGTAILHPDLGGGQLQQKFIRLRQRLSAPP